MKTTKTKKVKIINEKTMIAWIWGNFSINKLGYLSGNKAQQGLHKVREHGYVFFCSMPLINRGHQRAPINRDT
ncbi:MAG: hypothetical protein DRG73_08750, partial [Deltaproteobacteria bacterium]